MGSRVSRSTSLTSRPIMSVGLFTAVDGLPKPRSVISANVKLALLCRSTLSE